MIKWFLVVAALIPACCHGSDRDIHKMARGNKIIELADNRQLTFSSDNLFVQQTQISPNGKYVAFYSGSNQDDKLCIISASGGKPIVVLDNAACKNLTETSPKPDKPLWMTDGHMRLAWSPDSKFIAISAVLISSSGDDISFAEYILILTSKGQIYRSIKVPEGWKSEYGELFWSPDGKMVTGEFAEVTKEEDSNADTEDTEDGISFGIRGFLVFGVDTQTVKVAYKDEFLPQLVSWGKTGKSLYIVTTPPNCAAYSKLQEVFLDESKLRIIDENWTLQQISPDWVYSVQEHGDRIEVTDARTGQVVRTVNQSAYCFDGWLKQGRSFLYFKNNSAEISDEQKSRNKSIETLWLSSVNEGKLNHMCVAMDYDSHSASASADGMKIAYTSNYKVYVAELIQRDPDTDEKVELGLPLSEDDEKELLEYQGRQIARALVAYETDYQALPSSENVESSLLKYSKSTRIFYRPQTETSVFTYFPRPNTRDIENPRETVIGMLDAGFNWKINIYADGNVETVSKE